MGKISSEAVCFRAIPPLEKGGKGGFETQEEPYDKSLTQLSRNLRKTMADAEMVLWSRRRAEQLKDRQFYRQKLIENYIVDFYCPKSKLVVEVDGGQHYGAEGKQRDQERDASLRKLGMTVLRFSDRDVVTKLDAVLARIWNEL